MTPSTASNLPKLKAIDLQRVVTIRKKLIVDTWFGLEHVTLTGEALADLIARLHEDVHGLDESATFESLRGLSGQEFTSELMFDTAWRIAGNVEQLRNGVVVPPWNGQRELEWAPLQCLSARTAKNRWGETGSELTWRVLAGSACPLKLVKWWSAKTMRYLAPRLGFTKKYGKRPFQHPTQFAQLRMYALLAPELSSARSPGFLEVKLPGKFAEYNRKLIGGRYRLGFACPHKYTHPCHVCSVGYDQCPVATHPKTHYMDFCAQCGQEAHFDPDLSCEACIRCTTREVLQGEVNCR